MALRLDVGRDTVPPVAWMMKRRTWVLTALGLLPCTLAGILSCGGDSKSNAGDGKGGATATVDAGGSNGVGGSGGSDSGSSANGSGGNNTQTDSTATTGTGGGVVTDLSGTWDVIVSNPNGRAGTATVTLSPTQLLVTGELEVAALIANDIIDIAYEGEAAKATRQRESDMNLGVMPLPLAGALRFTGVPDEGDGCDYNLDAEELTIECTDSIVTPGNLPELNSADLDAVRTSELESIFGELGGRWTVTAEDVDCSVVFEGNAIDVSCERAGATSGDLTVTVEDGRISGSTSAGIEFTAQRR